MNKTKSELVLEAIYKDNRYDRSYDLDLIAFNDSGDVAVAIYDNCVHVEHVYRVYRLVQINEKWQITHFSDINKDGVEAMTMAYEFLIQKEING